ncbi:MAG TPA: LLM class flavin-dependent oxidoreductase, partial [Nitrolancea sp.]|nr:LLM class flavin-dependent oxidoreductase [Nitrolancea sp.]
MALGGARYGLAIPQIFVAEPVDYELIHRAVRQAEELGYASLWTQEQIIGSAATLEPVSLLSYVAALTTHVRLGASVLVLPLRNPVQLAKSLATLDQLSSGRLTVGLGLGGHLDRYAAFGLSPEHRVRRFNENLRVMRALWAEPSASVAGVFQQLRDLPMEPKPLQRPAPPIWFGGRQPAALRRAARQAEGWMGAGSSAISSFKEHVVLLREFLQGAGRDAAQFTIAKRLYIAVDDDRARAEQRLRQWFRGYYGSDELALRVSVFGDAGECGARIAEVVAAGAGEVLLNPVFDQLDQAERLAEIVG